MNKKIKVFSLPWHIAHQYELLKLPFEWNYLIQHTRRWSDRYRPESKDLNWVPYYEPGKYDLAILHVDQQCLLGDLGKSKVFREIKAQIKDIPIIVINHGTPVYPELFLEMGVRDGYKETDEGAEAWARDKMKELMKGVSAMVVNSHQAQKMWGFGQTIIHGIDPDEWWDLKKELRSISVISPAGIGQKYYGRQLLQETRSILTEKYGIGLVWLGEGGDAEFAPSWESYRKYLGRTLVYFNPTFGSPMPRSRTEAMMSGCCIVTTRHHDADTFIKDGVNGYIVRDNPEDCARVIADCVFNYKKTVQIGQEGRKTAIEMFNAKRFQEEWIALVEKVLGRKVV